ncbi:MAG: MFS transporter [Polyangiales bacterium]
MGLGQIVTGAWSDRVGRKGLIVVGMWVQAAGIAVVVLSKAFWGFALGGALLGVGTAMVYPTLLAAIGDVAHPSWRASAVGTYRLWRDLGYAFGALLAGFVADALGLPSAMWIVAGLTFASGVVVAGRMRETRSPSAWLTWGSRVFVRRRGGRAPPVRVVGTRRRAREARAASPASR